MPLKTCPKYPKAIVEGEKEERRKGIRLEKKTLEEGHHKGLQNTKW